MAREAWEEVSFQVQFLEDGTIRSGWFPTGEGSVEGNVAVDYVWGNFPLQPDDDRTDESASFGGGAGDLGWSPTYLYTSDSLRISDYTVAFNNVGGTVEVPADSHVIADDSYEGFPDFETEITQVPWVVGRSYMDGTVATMLAGYGLSVGTVITTTSEATAENRGKVKAQYPTGDSATIAGGTVDLVVFDTDSTADTNVPNIVGLATGDAQTAVESVSLVYSSTSTAVGATTVNDGTVRSQSPAAGTLVNTGTTVSAVLYAAPVVPDLAGLTEVAAEAALVAANLVKGTVTTSGDGATAENDGTVKSQTPLAGAKANTGSAVSAVLYAAPVVPDVTSLTEEAAEVALVAANFTKGAVTTSADGATAENDGLVKSQDPVAGVKGNTGGTVDLVLYAFAG